MKRIMAFLLALILCQSLVLPAYAHGSQFVESITYKGEPDIVPIQPVKPQKPAQPETATDPTEETEEDLGIIIGIVREEEDKVPPGQEKDKDKDKDDRGGAHDPKDPHDYEKDEHFRSYIKDGCIVVTPVAKAKESKKIPKKAAETLVKVYEDLNSGKMKLPYEEVEDIRPDDMVILELLDGSWLCGDSEEYDHDHPEEVAPEGIVFDITFKIGVGPNDKVVVMTYDEETEKWSPIKKVINNGDGTITCTFEHLCPIAISVERPDAVQTVDNPTNVLPWVIVMVVSLALIVGIFFFARRRRTKA